MNSICIFKEGRVKDWKIGMVEDWKNVRLEECIGTIGHLRVTKDHLKVYFTLSKLN